MARFGNPSSATSAIWFPQLPVNVLLIVILINFRTNAHQNNDDLLREYGDHQTLIGAGSTAAVHLYRRQNDSFNYAVKSFLKLSTGDTDAFGIATSLQHDSIIETHGLVDGRERWFQVMEYCPQTLSDAVSSEAPMKVSSAMCIFRQLIDGITYMHSQGIAHQDLSLWNIMLDTNGNAKIIDFGMAYRFWGPFDKVVRRRYGIAPIFLQSLGWYRTLSHSNYVQVHEEHFPISRRKLMTIQTMTRGPWICGRWLWSSVACSYQT